jgi:hypothetical protein
MLIPRRIVLPTWTRLETPLPVGLHRNDVQDYLVSRTFKRRAGSDLPRRELLLMLGASFAALTVAPAARATLVEGLKVAIEALALAKDAWEVGVAIYGHFVAQNPTKEPQTGNLLLAVINDRERIENNLLKYYEVPDYTTATLRFDRGPSALVRGNKTFQVSSEFDSDSAEFQAL